MSLARNIPAAELAAHQQFMDQALALAAGALAAGEFPVGCVLVEDGRVVATGGRSNSQAASVNEVDHAEMVAIRQLVAARPGRGLAGVVAYSTMEPCLMCFASLLLNGVRTVVYAYEDVMGGAAGLDLGRLAPLYRDMAVTVVPAVQRPQSLALFKQFFRDPRQEYWRDSLLARYTLSQDG